LKLFTLREKNDWKKVSEVWNSTNKSAISIHISVVNFINVLHANFTYKSLFGSFFYLHVTREKLLKKCLYEKFAQKNVDEIDTWREKSNVISINKQTNCRALRWQKRDLWKGEKMEHKQVFEHNVHSFVKVNQRMWKMCSIL